MVGEASIGSTGWERAALSSLIVGTELWRFVLPRPLVGASVY
jgi:hypothetical protein